MVAFALPCTCALSALISLWLLLASLIIITYFYNYHYNYLHLIPLLTLSHRGCQYLAGEQHFNISCFKQTRRWSPFYLLHCVFLCLCACFVERYEQAVGAIQKPRVGGGGFFRPYPFLCIHFVCCLLCRRYKLQAGSRGQAAGPI